MKQKNYVFNGLGFPVVLVDAPFRKTSYGPVLDVNSKRLQELVFEALIRKSARLSGAEVRFVRHYMELTQNTFADLLGVARSAVAKWESKDLGLTEMAPATETLLRIQMARHIRQSLDKAFAFIEPAVRKEETGEPLELAM